MAVKGDEGRADPGENGYRPPDATLKPRYTGIRTFGRVPHGFDWERADVAVLGVPFDTAASFRTGSRMGPAAIREQSLLLRDWHPEHEIEVFPALSVLDGGDLDVTPGNAEKTTEQIAEGLEAVIGGGVTPIVLGGDHSIALGELRAYAAAYGPVGVLLLDAHTDTWDSYFGERYFHGTPFRRAMEEGLIDPKRSLFAGMRGPLHGPEDLEEPRSWGIEILSTEELLGTSPDQFRKRVEARLAGGPSYLSFDIDVLDPAFAPGTGTPEAGGLTTQQAMALIRSLYGLEFKGFDIVEVSPQWDGPGQVTALNAATIGYEFLALCAGARSQANPSSGSR